MTEQQERYVHLFCCVEWLNEAWLLLNQLKDESSNRLAGTAFRFALVLYAKPFKASHGERIRIHRLNESDVPRELLPLHQRLINSRDQIHAHSDLSEMGVALYVGQHEGRQRAVLSRRVIDPHQEMTNIPEIIAMIEKILDGLEAKLKQAEAELQS
jgi:hypothetical protein